MTLPVGAVPEMNLVIQCDSLREIELIALEYIEANDIDTAISFYKSVSREKNSAIIKERLRVLHTNYSKYLFEYEPAAALVTFSE